MFASRGCSFVRRSPARRRLASLLIVAVSASSMAFTSCTSDEPELSTAEILAELEGRELTVAELAEREQVAQTLCRLDDKVLVEIWSQLSAKQLEFQDFVFKRACESRGQLYAESTGRFAVSGG